MNIPRLHSRQSWLSWLSLPRAPCPWAWSWRLQVPARGRSGRPGQGHAHRRHRQGALAPKQASALVSKRWANASGDLKNLAVLEEQATGVPLIAGNRVTLLFDGPATMREMMAAARAPPARSTWRPISSTRTRSATNSPTC
jgi:hypothetical protein